MLDSLALFKSESEFEQSKRQVKTTEEVSVNFFAWRSIQSSIKLGAEDFLKSLAKQTGLIDTSVSDIFYKLLSVGYEICKTARHLE